mgnify:CR=1 FL=1
MPATTRRHRKPKKPRTSRSPDTLAAQLAALDSLSRTELKARWVELYGTPCPPHVSQLFLRRALAYRIQEKVLGGLDRATRRKLDRIATDLAAGRSPRRNRRPKVKPGTRLLREWQGTVHEVIVLEKRVTYRGKTYASLSAVARAITGARWSGPRFFGIQGAPRAGRG